MDSNAIFHNKSIKRYFRSQVYRCLTLCKLYPDSNMIGGSITIKNIVGEKVSSL